MFGWLRKAKPRSRWTYDLPGEEGVGILPFPATEDEVRQIEEGLVRARRSGGGREARPGDLPF